MSDDMRIVDMHSHVPRADSAAGRAWRTDEVLNRLDRLGVERTVIMTVDGFHGRQRAANDVLARAGAESGGRLVPFCTVDPRDPGASDEVRRCVEEHGFRGIKLHSWVQGFSLTEPYMTPLAETAAALGVPVLFHDGTPPAATPLQVAYFAERHPATRVLLGHGGLMDLWPDAVAAAQRCPNLSIVLSGTAPLEVFAKVVELAGPGKVALGTDTRYELDDEYVSALRLERLRIILGRYGEQDRAALAYGNAQRLLGSPPC